MADRMGVVARLTAEDSHPLGLVEVVQHVGGVAYDPGEVMRRRRATWAGIWSPEGELQAPADPPSAARPSHAQHART